jgi:hypothetical protein
MAPRVGDPDAGRGLGVELLIPAGCLVHALFVVLLPRIVINWHVPAGRCGIGRAVSGGGNGPL